MRLTFGDCTFDSDTRELTRRGKPAHISPKAFRLLELLLESRPKALSKAAIHEKIWPDAFVSEATLASLVAEIREATGDSGKGTRFIRTVHGFGYAFSGTAHESPTRAPATGAREWRLIWEGREVVLSEGENLLGREPAAVAWIDAKGVSRHHARIRIDGTDATLEDLGSKNGTFLNGRKVEASGSLSDGDEIRLGAATMTLRLFTGEASTETVAASP